jgi:hypothetical protein
MGRAAPDLGGRRVGDWTVGEIAGVDSRNRPLWRCTCTCGTIRNVKAGNLVQGTSRGCGCSKDAKSAGRISERNSTHGGTGTPTYRSWRAMLARCKYDGPQNRHHRGQGVTVCERWITFEAFLSDMGERPAGTSLDRHPDPAGNYEPENCRWATPLQQRHNRRVDGSGGVDSHSQPRPDAGPGNHRKPRRRRT